MKKILLLSVIVLGVFFTVFSQTEKEIKKEWSKKMKDTDPLIFKKMMEENESMKKDLSSKDLKVNELTNQFSQKEDELKKVNEEFENYKKTIQTATTPSGDETDATLTPQKKQSLERGVVFKVQIGAFKNRDMIKYFENNKNFSGEVDTDGIKKYTLGYFNDYWEADNFKKYLREMGVKDAWIVPYKNGQRVKIKDVLEGVI